ncbi:MAG: TfoX family protein [Gemmatimonadetes bacterium]|nr:TfoX family protein [Gemmatimonadota bacterium]
MTVNETFRTFVLEQLGRVAHQIRSRAMFGGVGIYSEELFFALMDDDSLYFKVDDSTRPDFEARGLKPFQPFGEGGEVMQYYQVAPETLEDLEELRTWVDKAVAVARTKRARRPKSAAPPRKRRK